MIFCISIKRQVYCLHIQAIKRCQRLESRIPITDIHAFMHGIKLFVSFFPAILLIRSSSGIDIYDIFIHYAVHSTYDCWRIKDCLYIGSAKCYQLLRQLSLDVELKYKWDTRSCTLSSLISSFVKDSRVISIENHNPRNNMNSQNYLCKHEFSLYALQWWF